MATGFSVMDALNKNSKAAGAEDRSPKAKFRTKDLSVFKIYSNDANFYPQEGIEQKAGEIIAAGLLENLVVKYEPLEGVGEYKLISGERRWRALIMLVDKGYKEFEFVTCKIIAPTTPQEEKITLIMANSHRVLDMATMIREETELKETLEDMKQHGMELSGYDLQSGRLREVIADMLNISKTKVAQIEAVNNNLIPEFKEELNKNRLTFSAAYELSGMDTDEQRELLNVLEETGELTYQTIKDMKDKKKQEKEAAQVDGQMNIDEMQQEGDEWERTASAGYEEQQVSESDTVYNKTDSMETEQTAGDEYQTPHPDGITSICYSCTEYETCNVKSSTCTTCDQYKNRKEAYKTDEQRYSEEQDAIDRETAKKLREQEDEKKMEHVQSERGDGRKMHSIRLATMYFDDAVTGKKPFEIRKNDRDYAEGDILEMMEFKDGKNTGRTVTVLVTYLLKDYAGITDGYCIMGTKVISVNGVDEAAVEE